MDRQIGARRLRTRNTGWAGYGAVRRFWFGLSGLGVARFVSERRLWWGSLGRHRELHGGLGPVLSGLEGQRLAVGVRCGLV